jgi:hypothetical protein
MSLFMVKSATTIVLVHGAWADGSSWNKVIPSAPGEKYAGHRRANASDV